MNLIGIGSHVTGLGCGAWRVGKGTIGFLLLGGRIGLSDMARLWVLVPALREFLYCSCKGNSITVISVFIIVNHLYHSDYLVVV
jgi:hypothetical protein